jgi:GT2 family glycosyltransferase/glycosyltransferase involved in cell wall biosynthesis
MPMRVSVIVPTYKRPESLSRCLDALLRQDRKPDEILVVARRDDEASRRCMCERSEETIRFVPIEVPSGRPGFVAALNAGVDASCGEILCLTDDDAEPRPDWVSRTLATFGDDPSIAAVGGRDWVYHDGSLVDGEELIVGNVSRRGRVVGRHHLGVGPPRDVAVLKGVNLGVRGDLLRQVRFDTRLRGVTLEQNSEMGLCFSLLRMGFRIVYDPAIAVDHRPQPRVAETREFGRRQVRDAAHNETLALLEYLPPRGQMMHLLWTTAIGTRSAPGLAQAARQLLSTGDPKLGLLFGNLSGRVLAVLTYLGLSDAKAHKGRGMRQTSGSSVDAPSVLAIAHSPSASARAEQLLEKIPRSRVVRPSHDVRGIAVSAWLALTSRAKVLYLVDVGKTTALAALLGRLVGKRVIVDTGDACFALARSLGDRNFAGLLVVGVAEKVALRSAQEVVVRGRAHAPFVPGRATHIPDIPPAGVGPVSGANVRTSLGVDRSFVVGLVGSLNLSRRHRISYGWDLVEALSYTAPEVVALIVGDGSGLEALRGRARALAVDDRCRFVGRVPTERISQYVCAMDVALSTQTNDLVGVVRTTGKLPLYLACGCPVLASHVGEAAIVLGPLGWTVPYNGVLDRLYPRRLAAAVEAWRADPEGASNRRDTALRVAREYLDEDVMRMRLGGLIDKVTQ